MQVRVLGCSGSIAQGCRTTSFLIDGSILIDAGTGVGDLTLEEMRRIDHVFLTHSHLDHIAALPLMLDAVSSLRTQPVQVHALAATIDALRAHVFNNVLWPDFETIPCVDAPFVRFTPLTAGEQRLIGDLCIEALPAVHTVPAVGYAVQGRSGWWVFSGDTERNPAFWERINQLPLAMLVIETAFSERESDLARRSLHLSPRTLLAELDCLVPGTPCPIYITHTKPAETQLVMEDIHNLCGHGEAGVLSTKRSHDIRWLHVDQTFNV